MKVNLVAPVTLSIVLVYICDVLCLPNLLGTVDNAANFADSGVEVINNSESPSYSVLWKFNGSEEDIRVIQANLMRSYMNLSVEPCDDFYEYACGNWEHIHPIQKDKSENSVFMLLNNNIQYELRNVLLESVPETQSDDSQELGAEDKAKVYFAACIDEEAINRRGLEPLLQFIDELGGWPVLDSNWTEEGFDWLQLAIKTSLMDNPCILASLVGMDLKNSSEHSIYLAESRLGLNNREDFLNSKNVERLNAYRNLIVAILRLLDVDLKKAEGTAKEIVDLEIQIAEITPDYRMRIDLTELYTPTTIEELSKNYSTFDWLTYFSTVLNTPLQPNQTVIMLTPSYYGNLTRILKKTDSRTLANYMVWRSIHPFLHALDDNFRAAIQTFEESLSGQKEPLPRWEECLLEVSAEIGMATGAIFVRRYFDEDSKNETIALISDVKEAFRQTLLELDWIDEKTKELARSKVDQTKLAVGYPDYIIDPVKLNKLYTDLRVVPGKRFENSINLVKYAAQVRLKRFRKPVDKELWPTTPAVVNAFFEQTKNRIGVPAGILQPPMFHKHFPRALNYGAMGVFMGHELTHGFDDFGREFDAAGNMVKWWSPEAIKGFQERENCFIEQYGNFSMNGIPLEGTMTRGENLADNGGIRQAFRVYRKWQNVNGKEKHESSEAIPGLNLTNDQLFFLGFAQTWCNAIRPEAVENSIQTNAHCPGKFRVIGTLANFEEFSEVFQCPSGSVMNPQKKCRLW